MMKNLLDQLHWALTVWLACIVMPGFEKVGLWIIALIALIFAVTVIGIMLDYFEKGRKFFDLRDKTTDGG